MFLVQKKENSRIRNQYITVTHIFTHISQRFKYVGVITLFIHIHHEN